MLATTSRAKFGSFEERIYNPIPKDVFVRYSDKLEGQDFYHMHNVSELYLLVSGEVLYYVNKRRFKLSPGSLLFMVPNEYHRVEMLTPDTYERFVLNISTQYLETHSTPFTNLSECFTHRNNDYPNLAFLDNHQLEEIKLLLNNLIDLTTDNSYGQDVTTTAILLLLMVKVNQLFISNRNVKLPNTMPSLISRAIQYLDDHILDTFSLDDLANELFYNGTYISRKFKATTGLTIQQYILRKRIHMAQNYLQEGKSVTDSCMLSGFGEYTNFSRRFKEYIGVSPKQFQLQIFSDQSE